MFSDHNPLTYLTKSAPKSMKLLRWSIALQDLNAKFKYRASKDHVVPNKICLWLNFNFIKDHMITLERPLGSHTVSIWVISVVCIIHLTIEWLCYVDVVCLELMEISSLHDQHSTVQGLYTDEKLLIWYGTDNIKNNKIWDIIGKRILHPLCY